MDTTETEVEPLKGQECMVCMYMNFLPRHLGTRLEHGPENLYRYTQITIILIARPSFQPENHIMFKYYNAPG